jgi:hypothetical protein
MLSIPSEKDCSFVDEEVPDERPDPLPLPHPGEVGAGGRGEVYLGLGMSTLAATYESDIMLVEDNMPQEDSTPALSTNVAMLTFCFRLFESFEKTGVDGQAEVERPIGVQP